MKTKTCPHCKKNLLLNEFSFAKARKNKVASWCKSCTNEATKKYCAQRYIADFKFRQKLKEKGLKRYHSVNNHNKILKFNKKYCAKRYATDPEFREYRKRYSDKRHRGYGGTRIAENIIDEPVIRHHVNDNEVIDVPRDIHTMYPTYPKEVHRFMVNQVVEQIYEIKIKEIKDEN